MGLDKFTGLIPRLVNDEKINLLREDALDFAHCHGLVIRTRNNRDRSDICQNAPFALLPTPFPRSLYLQAVNVQPWMNLLYFRISFDREFLIDAHKDVVETDEFTRNMVDCFVKTMDTGLCQRNILLTQRADYMCHVVEGCEPELKQIEVNNIAVSMGGLAQRASLWHKRVLLKLGLNAAEVDKCVPDNEPVHLLASGLYQGWTAYGNDDAAVLVVIEKVNQNQLDMRFIEYELEKLIGKNLSVIRATLTECYDMLAVEADNVLRFAGQEIGLVYFRAGYAPDNYPTDKEWAARLRIEQSAAVKTPWIGLQLANTKKVQQVLAGSGVLEKFLPDQPKGIIEQIRTTFAGLWGLEREDKPTQAVIKDACAHPERYVLKPQLEGGGGNYYGPAISEKLQTFDRSERAAHILMERVQPLVVNNYHVRAMQPLELAKTVSELGVYGTLFGQINQDTREKLDLNNIHVGTNTTGGHILRSKADHVDEGGVAVGAAVIDTPFLVD